METTIVYLDLIGITILYKQVVRQLLVPSLKNTNVLVLKNTCFGGGSVTRNFLAFWDSRKQKPFKRLNLT